ncbi:hypothetical protein Sango_2474000 [Sesamum angolense]|uniref:Transposase MuDR plant domain-containing protein n=1 Tax=Sesamum angolense TaxID=2727404 RepID=A0AAE1W3Q4_9LAMI|nr:hypothetical protein Sango_2474000 [Sesamum angolense]
MVDLQNCHRGLDVPVNIFVEEEDVEPLVAIDSQGVPVEMVQEEEIRYLLEGIDFEELDGNDTEGDGKKECKGQGVGVELEGDGRKDCEGQGVELGVDENLAYIFNNEPELMAKNVIENFTEIPIQRMAENMSENVTKIPVQQNGENITKNVTEILVQELAENMSSKISIQNIAEKGEKKNVRKVLRDWCIKNGADIEFLRNEATRVTAKCKVKGCEWRIHASPIQDGPTFQIKTLKGKHTCARTYENKIANTSYLAGFMEGCRPIIGLDGYFLKTVYGGQLLVAVGRDGNDNMFPIAIFVLQVENRDTWGWFVGELLDDIGGWAPVNGHSFLTDRKAAARGTRNEAARVTQLPAPRTATQVAARGTRNEAARVT